MEEWFAIPHLHMQYIHPISLSLTVICDAPQISLHLPIRKATAEVIEPNKAGAAFVCWMLFRCSVMSNSCDPMDYSPPGFSAHEISQARILQWVAISFSRGSSQTRDRTHVSCIGRQILYHRATMEALCVFTQCLKLFIYVFNLF